MKSSIYPCIWFNGNAQEAAEHYCVAFANAGVKICTPMVVKANPSVSFFTICESAAESDHAWNILTEEEMV
jgi:predicted 3-demethylubiquinone-9 3-methyltransferase (glyoxalase superfamily)